MKDFIDSIGLNNFIILVVIVAAILLALVVIFIIDKISKRKKIDMSEYFDDETNDNEKEEDNLVLEFSEEDNNKSKSEIISNTDEITKKDDVIYIEETVTPDKAKKTLEEVTKKLVEEEPQVIGPTSFEMEQEEKSVISYEELKKINYNIDEVNDNVLLDEDNLPITIEELYKKHLEEQEQNEKVDKNPVFVETEAITIEEENKKFKNSELISPVFGIYGKKTQETNNKPKANELKETVELQDLELEIKKTEEFLRELKKLKDKLN